jgi:hypothetical protein
MAFPVVLLRPQVGAPLPEPDLPTGAVMLGLPACLLPGFVPPAPAQLLRPGRDPRIHPRDRRLNAMVQQNVQAIVDGSIALSTSFTAFLTGFGRDASGRWLYDWYEVTMDPTAATLGDYRNANNRSGNHTTGPYLRELNNTLVLPHTYVRVDLRGTLDNGVLVYEFDRFVNIPLPPNPPGINVALPIYLNVKPPTMSASGWVSVQGAAALLVPAPAMSASGQSGTQGTSGLSVPGPTMSASGTFTAAGGSMTYTTPGSYTFTASFTGNHTIECIGGGQSGSPSSLGSAGDGGAGAYFCTSVVSLTSGNMYSVSVGAGGAKSSVVQNVGGDTTFNSSTVIAPGGSSSTFAAGTTQNAGGFNGASGGPGGSGGGGGGAGGPSGAGSAGSSGASGGAGGASGGSPGGNGGNGGSPTSSGANASNYGGGGGGSGGTGASSGAGAGGYVSIVW